MSTSDRAVRQIVLPTRATDGAAFASSGVRMTRRLWYNAANDAAEAAEAPGGPRAPLRRRAQHIDAEMKRWMGPEKIAADDGDTVAGLKRQVGQLRVSVNQLAPATRAAFQALSLVAQIPSIVDELLKEGETKALQEKLAARGHDVGGIDGILGQRTRSAVQKEQQRLGLPADAWPTRELLDRL